MTSLVAWIAVDQHAPSAFYMASDSRISWGSANARWDAGRKLFACVRHPDIFGFTGEVVFPSLVLGQIIEAADTDLIFDKNDSSNERHAKFVDAVTTSFGRRHNAPDENFQILHASRQGVGPNAQFTLWCLTFNAARRTWADSQIEVPTGRSALLATFGSGEKSVHANSLSWELSAQGGTSRAIFSAFCDSVRSGTDPKSGGVPQLIGMYHTRMPQVFGIVQEARLYFQGFPVPTGVSPDAIEWRDELFQRIDGKTLKIAKGAQRHVRPKLR
jgi:hypothetical protein